MQSRIAHLNTSLQRDSRTVTKKKSLYFDATPLIEKHVSGVGKVLQETLKALDTVHFSDKYNLYIFVPFNEAKKARNLGYKHIKLKLLPYPHKFFSLFTRLRWAPPIDIFLGRGTYVFENFRNCTLLFSKSITYIHDVAFKVYPQYIQERNLAYLSKYIPLWISRTDKVIAVSSSAREEIERELDVRNVAVIPNAVNTTDFYPRTKPEITRVLNKWNIPPEYMIFIGNIEPRKNLVNTIRAFCVYVKNTGSNEALVLIGGGGWRNEEILAEIEKARNQGVEVIRPDGYVPDDDLPALITGASALLQLSWHEGFGLPVLQALACGTPVAASNITPLHEVASGNQERVEFADPDNISQLAGAIEQAAKKTHTTNPKNITTWNSSIIELENIVDHL